MIITCMLICVFNYQLLCVPLVIVLNCQLLCVPLTIVLCQLLCDLLTKVV